MNISNSLVQTVQIIFKKKVTLEKNAHAFYFTYIKQNLCYVYFSKYINYAFDSI